MLQAFTWFATKSTFFSWTYQFDVTNSQSVHRAKQLASGEAGAPALNQQTADATSQAKINPLAEEKQQSLTCHIQQSGKQVRADMSCLLVCIAYKEREHSIHERGGSSSGIATTKCVA